MKSKLTTMHIKMPVEMEASQRSPLLEAKSPKYISEEGTDNPSTTILSSSLRKTAANKISSKLNPIQSNTNPGSQMKLYSTLLFYRCSLRKQKFINYQQGESIEREGNT